jgi:hypothetical protein
LKALAKIRLGALALALDTLVDLFAVYGDISGSVDAERDMVALHLLYRHLMWSPIMMASPTRLVRMSILMSLCPWPIRMGRTQS